MKIKTRFAPSPTGCLHLGGARTALYSWLYARHNNGKFILRIEDTDLKRSNLNSINDILDSMNWLNLNWDEGPFFQTERFSRYNDVINSMLKEGSAYKCYCSKEQLDQVRLYQINHNQQTRYNRYCRNHYYNNTLNKPYVVRFKNPTTGIVEFQDKIRGKISFKNENLDDLIIRRSDGTPTYNFCSVIDDLDMKITHIIRGDDHINNTPRQINIFKALNAKVPLYAHVSMITGENGKKLSKRYETISLMKYRDDGYLPESILNYLVRLGWSHGNQEIFSINEMINFFDLESINKSFSMLNNKKLQWLNQYYIQTLPVDYIANHLKWQFIKENIRFDNGPKLKEIVLLTRNRCKTLKNMLDCSRFFYEEINNFDSSLNKYLRKESISSLNVIYNKLLTTKEWSLENIHNIICVTVDELQLNFNELAMPLRIALTGTSNSPPIDKIIHLMGRCKSILRIEKIINFINQ